MKTIIVYASKHGCVEKCAQLLTAKIAGAVQLCNLTGEKNVQIADFDTVIIGGSIHAGRIQKEIAVFCERNKQQLLAKKLGLFLCCANLKQYEKHLKEAFPEELIQHAATVKHLGYAFYFDKMNFIERTVIRKLTGTDKTQR